VRGRALAICMPIAEGDKRYPSHQETSASTKRAPAKTIMPSVGIARCTPIVGAVPSKFTGNVDVSNLRACGLFWPILTAPAQTRCFADCAPRNWLSIICAARLYLASVPLSRPQNPSMRPMLMAAARPTRSPSSLARSEAQPLSRRLCGHRAQRPSR